MHVVYLVHKLDQHSRNGENNERERKRDVEKGREGGEREIERVKTENYIYKAWHSFRSVVSHGMLI
jgi:hypothetical protein